MILNLPDWIADVKEPAIAMMGGVLGYLVTVWTKLGKIVTDLAFVKGQLTQILRVHSDVDKLKEAHSALKTEHAKTRRDVDAAHEKLRDLKTQAPNSHF